MASSPTQVIREFIDAFNRADLEGATALIAPDAVDHAAFPGQSPGLEGWCQKWDMFHASFSSLHWTIEQSVEEGDIVASRYTVRGVHSGDFMGAPATGRTLEAAAMDMIRVRDGKILEHWALLDQAALMAQMGMMDASA
jgi:steroid delta-isomerase-like uncharacterized protein